MKGKSFTYTIHWLGSALAFAGMLAGVGCTSDAQSNDQALDLGTREAVIAGPATAILAPLSSQAGDFTLETASTQEGASVVVVDDKIHFRLNHAIGGEFVVDYAAVNNVGAHAAGQILVEARAVAIPPIAIDDQVDVPAAARSVIDVLLNDVSELGLPLALKSIDSAASLGARILADGGLLLEPASGVLGVKEIGYVVADTLGGLARGTLTVTVGGVNAPPLAEPDFVHMAIGTVKSIDLMENDLDADGDGLVLISFEGEQLLRASVNGSVVKLGPYFSSGTLHGSYTIGDGKAVSESELVVVVGAPNRSPLALGETIEVLEDTTTELDLGLNDSDPDGDTLAIEVDGVDGIDVVSMGGTSVSITPHENVVGDFAIPYRIVDGRGGSSDAVLNASVKDVADAPRPTTSDIYAQGVDAVQVDREQLFVDDDGDDVVTNCSMTGQELADDSMEISEDTELDCVGVDETGLPTDDVFGILFSDPNANPSDDDDADADDDGVIDPQGGADHDDGTSDPTGPNVNVTGGGCSTSNSGGSALGILFVLGFAYFMRRRNRACGLALVAVLATSAPVLADGFRVDNYSQPTHPSDLLWTETAEIEGHLQPFGRISVVASDDPLVERIGDVESNRIIDSQFGAHVSAGVSLYERYQVSMLVPVLIQSTSESSEGVTPTTSGLGGITVGGRAQIFSSTNNSVAISAGLVLPGDSDAMAGSDQLGGKFRVIATRRFAAHGSLVSLSVGSDLIESMNYADLEIGSTASATAGVRWGVSPALSASAELAASTVVKRALDLQHTPVEATVGGRYIHAASGWSAVLGVGTALTQGFGAPDARAMFSIGYQPQRPRLTPQTLLAEEPLPQTSAEPAPVLEPVKQDVIASVDDSCIDKSCGSKVRVDREANVIEILEPVMFKTDRATIDARSFAVLSEMATVIKAHPELGSVLVEGHTDSSGTAAYNRDLSSRRAKEIVAFMVELGVNPERLSSRGFGESLPQASNSNEEGREQNRRVVFRLVDIKPVTIVNSN